MAFRQVDNNYKSHQIQCILASFKEFWGRVGNFNYYKTVFKNGNLNEYTCITVGFTWGYIAENVVAYLKS